MKWLFPAFVSLLIPLAICLTGQIRKPLLILSVLSLQADYALFLGDWSETAWVGMSGPSGLFLSFGTIACVLFLAYDRLILLNPAPTRFEWGRVPITIPFLVMTLAAAGTAIYSPERMRVVYYVQIPVYLYLFFVLGLNTAKSREDFTLIMRLLMMTLAVQAVIYFTQAAMGVGFNLRAELSPDVGRWAVRRYGGTVATHPAPFASFILPLLMIALSRFLLAKDARLRSRMALLGLIGILTLLLTFTRAAWIGFALGLLWLVVLATKRGGSTRRVALIAMVACIGAAILWPMIALRAAERGSASALDERSALMAMAWAVIKANPLLGVGAGAYSFVFRQYLPPEFNREWLFVVHNQYLLQWAETGILGVLGLVAFWIQGLRESLRASRAVGHTVAALGTGLSAAVIALIWEMWWDISLGFQAQALVFFLLGVTLSAPRTNVKDQVKVPAKQRKRSAAYGVQVQRWSWQA